MEITTTRIQSPKKNSTSIYDACRILYTFGFTWNKHFISVITQLLTIAKILYSKPNTSVTSEQILRCCDKTSAFVNVLKKIFPAKHSKEASHWRSRYLRQHQRCGHPTGDGIMRPHAAGFYNPSYLTHDFVYLVSGSVNLNTILAGSPRHYAFCLYTQI